MLVARTIRIRQEEIERRKAQWEREERERAEFVRLMQELEEWIKGWNKAKQIREFVHAVEKSCETKGIPTTADSPKGKWILWALRQADRFDPLVEA
jgi:hypothetical protein